MTVETMTIRRAQSEKKLLDDRIAKLQREMEFSFHYFVNEQYVNGLMTVTDKEEKIKSDVQSLGDMIKRREAINKAIMDNNVITKVTVPVFAGFSTEIKSDDMEEISLALAINRKNYYQGVLQQMIKNFSNKITTEENNHKRMKDAAHQKALEETSTAFYGVANPSQDKRAQVEADKLEKYKVAYSSPINARKMISVMETLIEDYINNIDNILSNKTETTIIEIKY